MKIREAQPTDVPHIVRLFHETIHTVNARDYSTEELNAWSPAIPDAAAWAERMFFNRITFVADDHGTVAGFGELEVDGHIDCLYCHHDYQRRGVGAAILRRIEGNAQTLGVTRLFVEASITARQFFEVQGFVTLKQQTVVRQGVELSNFVMEKQLADVGRPGHCRRITGGNNDHGSNLKDTHD